MMPWLLLGSLLVAASPAAAKTAAVSDLSQSVVSIHVRTRMPNLLMPWRLLDPMTSEGSGVILEGGHVLTAAHVVQGAVRVEVRRADSPRRYKARIIHSADPCDLALLEVESPEFHLGARPLAVGAIAAPGATVQVAGFPIGGESLAVTEGVVSRYEIGSYPTSREEILQGQVDAPLNEGASGGPVVLDGSVVGVASAILEDAENVGYIVPAPVIEHFLQDVADGDLDGFPRLGVWWQVVANDAHRKFLGLQDPKQGALLVSQLLPGGTGVESLRPGDVVTKIDGTPIGRDGSFSLTPGVRVDAEYLVQAKQVGEPLELTVVRGGEPHELEAVARPLRFVIPTRSRRYVVFAGIVFQPLTIAYGLEFSDDLPFNLLSYYERESSLPRETREIIVLSTFLEHEITRGYEMFEDEVLTTVNGTSVRDLEHFAELVDAASGPWIELTTDTGSALVFDLEAARASFADLAEEYGIPSDRQLSGGSKTSTQRGE